MIETLGLLYSTYKTDCCGLVEIHALYTLSDLKTQQLIKKLHSKLY